MKKEGNSKLYQVKQSSAGLGLFATKPFKKGDFIIEYTGEIISREEADRRGGKYLFETSSRRVIDGKGRENVARYINHSCKPNCEPDVKGGRVKIYAIKKIAPGEEFTYDYGEEYFDDIIKPHGCRCAVHHKKRGGGR